MNSTSDEEESIDNIFNHYRTMFQQKIRSLSKENILFTPMLYKQTKSFKPWFRYEGRTSQILSLIQVQITQQNSNTIYIGEIGSDYIIILYNND